METHSLMLGSIQLCLPITICGVICFYLDFSGSQSQEGALLPCVWSLSPLSIGSLAKSCLGTGQGQANVRQWFSGSCGLAGVWPPGSVFSKSAWGLVLGLSSPVCSSSVCVPELRLCL